MDYDHIKNYLNKFKEILFSKEENIRIISSVIKKNTQIDIEPRFIKTTGNIIQIKASPLVKGEILIKKDKIILDLSIILENTKYKDIR